MALDQSTDLADRAYNCINALINAIELSKSIQGHYIAEGGASALDLYFQQAAPPQGPTQPELVDAIGSLIALLTFIVDNNHITNFYKVKSKGSSVRI